MWLILYIVMLTFKSYTRKTAR